MKDRRARRCWYCRCAPETLPERFLEKVLKTDGCWLWTGATGSGGYGRVAVGGGRTAQATHVAYEMHIGPVPEGAHLLHSCDTPACVNPAHLSPGTHRDNMADMAAKGRGRTRSTYRFSDEQVIEIRRRHGAGASVKRLAVELGVAQGTIATAITGSWRSRRVAS